MKCLLINLDRSSDRLVHCEREFNKVSVLFSRVSAVDASDLDEDFIDSIRLHDDWPKQTVAEFACFISHRKCWEIIANGDQSFGAVFEDDVILSPDSNNYLKDFSWIPDGIDVVKLETMKEISLYRRFGFSIANRKLHKIISFQAGAAGYIISKKFAVDILRITENYLPAPVDHFLFDPRLEVMQRYVAYQLIPALCIQDCIVNRGEQTHQSLIGTVRSVEGMKLKKIKLSHFQKFKRETTRIFLKLYKSFMQKLMIVDFQ